MRTITLSLWTLMALAGSAVTICAQPAAPMGLNAADLYRPVFSNVVSWTKDHPGFGRVPTNVTGPEAAKAYADLVPALDALKDASKADYVDWGTKFDDGVAATLPHLSPALATARAAQWAANRVHLNRDACSVHRFPD